MHVTDRLVRAFPLPPLIRICRRATKVRPHHPDGHLALVDLMLKLCSFEMCGWSACTSSNSDVNEDVAIAMQKAELALDEAYAAATTTMRTLEDVVLHRDDMTVDSGSREGQKYDVDVDGLAMAYHRLSQALSAQVKLYKRMHVYLSVRDNIWWSLQFPGAASRLLRKSLSLRGENMKALAQLVLLSKRLGDLDEARRTLSAMELHTPGNEMITRMRAML